MQYPIVNYRKARKTEDLLWEIKLPDCIAEAFIDFVKAEKFSFWIKE
jgi:hypothetical protein